VDKKYYPNHFGPKNGVFGGLEPGKESCNEKTNNPLHDVQEEL